MRATQCVSTDSRLAISSPLPLEWFEVAELLARRADAAEQRLATLAIDTELRFASAADRADFTDELALAVRALAAKYHDETAADGRWHRLVVAAHPMLGDASHAAGLHRPAGPHQPADSHHPAPATEHEDDQ